MLADMNQVEDTILSNVNRLDAIMKENNTVSEDNSATTQQLAAGMEETSASASRQHIDFLNRFGTVDSFFGLYL